MGWNGLRPSQFTLQILRDGSELQRKIAAAMLRGVIMGSPVDQGAFRSNHRVTLGTQSYKIFQGNGNKSPKGTLDQDTFMLGANEILKVKLGSRLFIQNNLPYSIRLENGWSDQAGLGIYAITFQSVTSKYK